MGEVENGVKIVTGRLLRPYFIFVSRVNLSLDMCTTGPLFRLLPDSSRT